MLCLTEQCVFQPHLWATVASEKKKELGPLKKKHITRRIELTQDGEVSFIEKPKQKEPDDGQLAVSIDID